jgi:hypothetical protein
MRMPAVISDRRQTVHGSKALRRGASYQRYVAGMQERMGV